MERKIIFKYIISIVVTFNFLIIGTLFWYNLHLKYQDTNSLLNDIQRPFYIDEVNMNNITKCNNVNELPSYKVVLKNDDINKKQYFIRLVNDYYNESNNSKKINNNYIKYMIKEDNGGYGEIMSLNMNGDLYFDTLDVNEEKTYELKVWVSNNYQYDDTFNGNIMILYV